MSEQKTLVLAVPDEDWKRVSFSAFELYEQRLKQGATATPEDRVKVIDEILHHAVGLLTLAAAHTELTESK
jgi:hypothetical protein